MGSAEAAAMRRQLGLDSPGVQQQLRPGGAAAAVGSQQQQPQQEAVAVEHPAPAPETAAREASEAAAWLVAGLAQVGAASRGSAEALRSPSQLLGRKVRRAEQFPTESICDLVWGCLTRGAGTW